jgi:alpha-amylase/alpha-mannosidase (GH57 family)
MIHLAFLWHFHQPSYHDLKADRLLMPWVRIHGVKDYTGMAALLEEFPEIRCTANFSPCLLDQLLAYGRGAEDFVLQAVRKPPAGLTDEERAFLRRQLFFAHPDRHIGRVPRYAELRDRERAGAVFGEAEWLDLETLHALVWIHPCVFERDEELRRLAEKGRSFTQADRDLVLARHLSLVGEVIPRWRKLQDAGRVEISVSPYYHPILPLLCDFESARRAMPDTPPPPLGKSLAPDAAVHVARARKRGEELFGRAPSGCWPSEGSVSPEAVALMGAHGFRWFATDQEILERSGGGDLYRPHAAGSMTGVFRDKALSNLLGFTYKSWDAKDAAADFVRRVEESGADDRLVVVAMDGENAWEHYADNGVPFLRELYRRLSGHARIRTVTLSGGLEKVPPGEPIGTLWSGSWINHNFAVWMGHEEDRRAWELLGEVRRRLEKAGAQKGWEALYQAEGSDWFWWFGEEYSSPQDAEFDALFRRHLANACALAGVPAPEDLPRPIRRRRREDLVRRPAKTLAVAVDGRRTDYFEWIGAGRYDLAREFGAMSGELSFLTRIEYGCESRRLALRFDFRSGVDPGEALRGLEIRIVATQPAPRTVALLPPAPGVELKVGEVFEVACPLELLGAAAGAELEFHVVIARGGGRIDRLPALASLVATVPKQDHESKDWHV